MSDDDLTFYHLSPDDKETVDQLLKILSDLNILSGRKLSGEAQAMADIAAQAISKLVVYIARKSDKPKEETIDLIKGGLFDCSDRPAEMRGMMQVWSAEYGDEIVRAAAERLGKVEDFERAMREMKSWNWKKKGESHE